MKKICINVIAEYLDYDIIGDKNIEISNIKYVSEADENSISVAYTQNDILKSNSKVVLTVPKFVITDKTLIYCHDNIEVAFIKIVELMSKMGLYPDYSTPIDYKPYKNNVLVGENVKIGKNTIIEPFVTIGDNVSIGNDCHIYSNSYISSDTVIQDDVTIYSGAKIGADSFFHTLDIDGNDVSFIGVGKVIIKQGSMIGYNTIIQRGTLSDTIIGENTMIDNLIDIGHDTKIGSNCKIVSQTGISGNVTIGNNVKIFGQVGIANYIHIGDNVVIKGGSVITKNIDSNRTISGKFNRDNLAELRFQAKLKKFFDERNV